jgi:ribonucleotide reductase alpha subunit
MYSLDTIKFFGKHFVTMRWMDKTPGERAAANGGQGLPQVVSCFVISVRGLWFLTTAGHILSDLG